MSLWCPLDWWTTLNNRLNNNVITSHYHDNTNPLTTICSHLLALNSYRCAFEDSRPIITKFGTRHDSRTVVTCTKFRYDRPTIIEIRGTRIFSKFWIRSNLSIRYLVGQAPGALFYWHSLSQIRAWICNYITWRSGEGLSITSYILCGWQWAETLVEIRGTLADIRGNTK